MKGEFWWIDKWRSSSAYMDLSLAEQGAYRNLLDEMCLREGPIPDNERTLGRVSGDAAEWPAVRDNVLAKLTLTKKGWVHPVQKKVMGDAISRREKASAKARNAAKARWKGHAPSIASSNAQAMPEDMLEPCPLISDLRSPSLNTDLGEECSVGKTPPPPGKPGNGVVTRRIFDQWVTIMGKNPRQAKLTPKRQRLVEARLREGYTEDEIIKAIRGCLKSPHHMGENGNGKVYNSLELICRDGEHIEQFLDDQSGLGKGVKPESTARRLWRVSQEMKKEESDGKRG